MELKSKRKVCSSYHQQDGRTVLLAPQNQSLHLPVQKQCGRVSLQSWASSPPPAWGSYPWGSEGSSGVLRSAERGGSSRSWQQPSSAGRGAAGLRLHCWLVRSAGKLAAHCLSSVVQVEGMTVQLRDCWLHTSSDGEEGAAAPWRSLSQLSCFLSELSKDPLVFFKKNQKCHLWPFP